MRIRVELDRDLVREAQQLSGVKTTRELVHRALLEFRLAPQMARCLESAECWHSYLHSDAGGRVGEMRSIEPLAVRLDSRRRQATRLDPSELEGCSGLLDPDYDHKPLRRVADGGHVRAADGLAPRVRAFLDSRVGVRWPHGRLALSALRVKSITTTSTAAVFGKLLEMLAQYCFRAHRRLEMPTRRPLINHRRAALLGPCQTNSIRP